MIENTQPIEKPIYDRGGNLEVHSVWDTIQGEGPFSGMPATFVRLFGCNLACKLCDTDYTSNRDRTSPADLFDKISSLPRRSLVVFTGGEPFRQNIMPISDTLIMSGRRVQIETNGTLFPEGLESYSGCTRFFVVCSPKTPTVNPRIWDVCHSLKYVVEHGRIDDDGFPLSSVGPQYGAPARPPNWWLKGLRHEIYIQPLDTQDEESNRRNIQAAVGVCAKHGFRLSLQIHKIVEVA